MPMNKVRRSCLIGLSTLAWQAGTGLRPTHAQAAPLNLALDSLDGLRAHDVVLGAANWQGRKALRVDLSAAVQKRVTATQNGNQPAFALLPGRFGDGSIEVDIGGEVNGRGDRDSRAFVGVAFHIPDDLSVYEAVYLRMTNGRLALPTPPAPRIDRAIQYTAHPDFHFDVSRRRAPGRYENGADIAPGRWTSLRLVVAGTRLQAYVGGSATPALEVSDLRYAGRAGQIGLWVDDGTAGYFANLRVQPA
jgi:hypothetical protein